MGNISQYKFEGDSTDVWCQQHNGEIVAIVKDTYDEGDGYDYKALFPDGVEYYVKKEELREIHSSTDLLKRAYTELRELTEDEVCDHNVNICWCTTFQLIEDIKDTLGLTEED